MIKSIGDVYKGGLKAAREYVKADDIDNLKDGQYAIYRNALAVCYNGNDQVVYIHDENDRIKAVLHSSNGLTRELIDNKIRENELKV